MTAPSTTPSLSAATLRLTPVSEAIERLLSRLPSEPIAHSPSGEITGHAPDVVLAEDLVAAVPMAARADRLARRVGGRERGDGRRHELRPAYLATAPVTVHAGERLPPGADAVLPVSAVEPGPPAACLETAAPWEGARRAGGDVPAGAVLARKGQRVTPALSAALQAVGMGGAPSADHGGMAFAPGVDSVTRAVVAALTGGVPRQSEDAAAVLVRPWRRCDSANPGLVCEGLALAPGEAAWIAAEDGRAVLHIPPLFGAAVAISLAVIHPMLAQWRGTTARPGRTLPLARKIASRVGWSEIALLGVEREQWVPLAVGDVTISGLARAEAWALIPPESEGAPAGAPLAAHDFGAPL